MEEMLKMGLHVLGSGIAEIKCGIVVGEGVVKGIADSS